MSFNHAARSGDAEWMDTEATSPEDFAACLRDLAAVNTVTLARHPTLGFMRRLAARAGGQRLRIMDVGCGDGDMLRRLHRWAVRGGHALELTGIDLNPLAIQAAEAATPPECGIIYRCADALDPANGQYDAMISSLFTHHLADDEIVRFLEAMERGSRRGWFVNDLHRHPVAYHGFRALSTLAGWHRFVRHDGPISVARSFRRSDWMGLLRQAGLEEVAQVRWRLPFRYCVTRLK